MAADPVIRSGTCHALFAYEVAYAIDLDRAQSRLTADTERQAIKQKRRAPSSFVYRPAPLRASLESSSITLGAYQTAPVVDVVLYDFGAVSVSYEIPLAGPFSGLPALSEALLGNVALRADSRRLVERLLQMLGDAAARPLLAGVDEDYAIFEIREFAEPVKPELLRTACSATLAQILRAESRALSEQEVSDALEPHLSFAADDVTFIDSDAALMFDREGDDVLAVLELANSQLLELRLLDEQLDRGLDQAYEMLSRQRARRFGIRMPDVGRTAELQLDSAVLFEQVSNAVKLIGDQYLSRVYGLVSQRFKLEQWDISIGRKLGTLESIYTKMADQASARRMETLEWIIVILIALEIVLSFLGVGK